MLMLTVQPLTRRVGCAVFAADRYPATRGEHAVRVFCSSGHENVVSRGRQREEGRKEVSRTSQAIYLCEWRRCGVGATIYGLHSPTADGTTPVPYKGREGW
jgi:hypothetical protein